LRRLDARPIASDQNLKDPANGNIILTSSMQNGGNPGNVPAIIVMEVFDDESQISGHATGLFVGSGRTFAPSQLQTKQTVHERMVLMNVPANRKITKIILDPNDGRTHVRYLIKDENVARLREIPLPAATP